MQFEKLNTYYTDRMRKKDISQFTVLFFGWMLLIFFMMTPEVVLVDPSYLATKRFAIQYGLYGYINFVIFYVSSFVLTPRYFQTRRYRLYFAICVISLFVCGVIKYAVAYPFGDIVLGQYRMKGQPEYVVGVKFTLISLRNTGISLMIGLAHRSFLDWIRSEKQKRELEKQKHTAEMAFLKMQVNPHFLFNALNNLYSLATLEKGSKTADGIMKLSDMFRYMLYEKEDSNNKVSLLKEIAYLNSYIDLLKLRYDHSMNINFTIEGDPDVQRMPPLLLFPILENACKHGILDDPSKPVTVSLNVTPTTLCFHVNNSINNYLKDQAGGIGLDNIMKRLQLLYPQQKVIKIQHDETTFDVELKIPL